MAENARLGLRERGRLARGEASKTLCDIIRTMTNKTQEAIEVLRNLPEEDADVVADAIIGYGADDDRLQLSDEHVAEIQRRMASPTRKFLSLAELKKRIHRFGA